MKAPKDPPRLSIELRNLAAAFADRPVTFGSFAAGLTPRDHALLVLCLSISVCHPFPLMGLAIPIGLIMSVAGARMALGLGPWIPARWSGLHLPGKVLARVFGFAAKGAVWLERVLPGPALPRSWLHNLQKANGAAIAVCGLLLALPLPPPTNLPPAAAAAVLCLAVLLENAPLLFLGYLAFALNILFFGAIAALGLEGVRALLV